MLLCFGVVVELGAAIFVLSNLASLSRYFKARKWARVQGEIVEAGVIAVPGAASSSSSSAHYQPRVVFRYRVQGQEYFGERVRFGASVASPSRAKAEEGLGAYRPGMPVTVYYDPQRPHEAVLEPTSLGGLRIGCGLTLVLVLLGLALIAGSCSPGS